MSSINTLAQIIFWSSTALFFYVYVGYPLIIFMIGRVYGKPVFRAKFEPTVSIIITAYNEEKSIRSKIENTLRINYPNERLEILVASDGSTDNTDAIVEEYCEMNVRLFRQEGRVGKTTTQNKAVEQANGEIILFSDATTMYQPDVLQAILPNFADLSVGCVAGKLIYVNHSNSGVGKGAKSYWSYETLLKESESKACSLIGVSGCLYAVRKSVYVPMYPEACSDFLICTLIYRLGFRSVYEPSAICTEETNRRTDKEFQMRVRIIAQTFTDLWRNRDMLNPLRTGLFAVQLISHKLLRYLVPVFLLTIFISTGILAFDSVLFAMIFILQIIFYSIALLTWVLESRNLKLGILTIPLYFVLTNLASAIGFYKFLRGEHFAQWEPIR